MAVRTPDWNEPIREEELPDDADIADGQNTALVPCPSCGELISDEADRCPDCGDWVIAWSPATRRAIGWFWPVMVALLIGVILVLWHGL